MAQSHCDVPVLGTASNADVTGIAIAVANVVVNICLRFMVTWSPEDVDVGVKSLLIQIYPILLSTLSSANSRQLSPADAYIALHLSSSPLTLYVVVVSIGDLLGIRTGLYKRIKSHRLIVRALGVMVLPLWIWLNLTYYLFDTAFGYGVDGCDGFTFTNWLLHLARLIYFTFFPGVFPLLPFISTTLLILYVLFKNRVQMIGGVRAHWNGASNPWGRLLTPGMLVKCTWYAIDRNHKWFVYALVTYLDTSWAFWAIVVNISVSAEGYVLSYGQVSALLATAPTLMSATSFIYSRRWDLFHSLQRLPRVWLEEVRNLLTRKKLDPPVQDLHLPFNVTSYPEGPILGKPRDQIITNVRSTYQPPSGQDTRFCTSCATPVNAVCNKA